MFVLGLSFGLIRNCMLHRFGFLCHFYFSTCRILASFCKLKNLKKINDPKKSATEQIRIRVGMYATIYCQDNAK